MNIENRRLSRHIEILLVVGESRLWAIFQIPSFWTSRQCRIGKQI